MNIITVSVMKFSGAVAIITGSADGMGKEVALRLCAEGCDVALCDISEQKLIATHAACVAAATGGALVSMHVCDVSIEAQVQDLPRSIAAHHRLAGRGLLLYNNAGVNGGGSMILNSREEWDRTFAVCWGGVYYMCRAFLPLLLAAPEGHVVNVSSINGIWASAGHLRPHTAYSAAKFAVRGF